MRIPLVFFLVGLLGCTPGSKNPYSEISRDRDSAIVAAQAQLQPFLQEFDRNLVSHDLDSTVAQLVAHAHTPAQKFVIAERLLTISPERARQLHAEAFEAMPEHPDVRLKHAMELHRAGDCGRALDLYQSIRQHYDYEENLVNSWAGVLSADCYLNLDEPKRACDEYLRFNRIGNGGLILRALFELYGPRDQYVKRDSLRKRVSIVGRDAAFELIDCDLHWPEFQGRDSIHQSFVEEDIRLLNTLYSNEPWMDDLRTFARIREFGKLAANPAYVDSITTLLRARGILIDRGRTFPRVSIDAEVLGICFERKIIDPRQYLAEYQNQLVRRARDQKDTRTLKLLIYWLENPKEGSLDMAWIGWKACDDPWFANRYLLIKGEAPRLEIYDHTLDDVKGLSFDDPELNEALAQFPSSSQLHWLKANCAAHEGRPVKEHIINALKFEMRTLDADDQHTTNGLTGFYVKLMEVIARETEAR